MKFIATLVLLLFTIATEAFAQTDTTYYYGDIIVQNRNDADNYTLHFEKVEEKYKVSKKYLNHTLCAEGHSLYEDSIVYDGLYKEYFENGYLSKEGSYKAGKEIGTWKTYYKDKGILWATIEFKESGDTAQVLKSYYKSGKLKRVEYQGLT